MTWLLKKSPGALEGFCNGGSGASRFSLLVGYRWQISFLWSVFAWLVHIWVGLSGCICLGDNTNTVYEILYMKSYIYTIPTKYLNDSNSSTTENNSQKLGSSPRESQPHLLPGGIWWFIETGNALPSGSRFRQHKSGTPDKIKTCVLMLSKPQETDNKTTMPVNCYGLVTETFICHCLQCLPPWFSMLACQHLLISTIYKLMWMSLGLQTKMVAGHF